MKKLNLNTPVGSSDILISESVYNLSNYCDREKTILLVDENVMRHHSKATEGFFHITVPSGESSKSLESYARIFGEMLEQGVDRSWSLVGIGGGITTDLSGFVASTYFRGIPYGFVSTTLLGQVDAAIGGKNGINYKGYKNLIGIIRQPEFVINDIESLQTLPQKEFTGGLAEVIKYGFIRKPSIYHFVNENLGSIKNFDLSALEKIVYDSVKVKVDIVESDVSEKGERKLLNFGHTFAHALEKLSHISHGEAVSAGMVMAARLSVNLGFCDISVHDDLLDICSKAGLPVETDIPVEELIPAMLKDKKKSGNNIAFILLKKTGKAFIHEVAVNELKSLLNDLY